MRVSAPALLAAAAAVCGGPAPSAAAFSVVAPPHRASPGVKTNRITRGESQAAAAAAAARRARRPCFCARPRSRRGLPPFRDATRPLSASAGGDSGGGVKRPENEFSRLFKTDVVLPRNNRRTRGSREYRLSVSADGKEREALAGRFRLSEIAKLEADLVLKNDGARGQAYKSEFRRR